MTHFEDTLMKVTEECENAVKNGLYKDFASCMEIYKRYPYHEVANVDPQKLLWEPIIWYEVIDATSKGINGLAKYTVNYVYTNCVENKEYLDEQLECLRRNGPRSAKRLLLESFPGDVGLRIIKNIIKTKDDLEKFKQAYRDEWRRVYNKRKEIMKESQNEDS